MDLPDSNWLIVGLGNPGREYESTRHNVGFMLADVLANEWQTQVRREECQALIGRAKVDGRTVEIAKPLTFMNLSGNAVSCLISKAARSVEKLIVISDDLALPFGTIRIRPRGSHGGQNGLRSIIDQLKTQEFIRLRIGIGPEHEVKDHANFVLQNFTRTEASEIGDILKRSAAAVNAIIAEGAEAAMAKFN